MAKAPKDEPHKFPRGRPSKLTDAIQAELCDHVDKCNTLEDAAALAGLERSTVFRWMQKGREQSRGRYRDFFNAIEAAKSGRRKKFAITLMGHGLKNWKAMAWLAERTDPERFGLRLKVQVNEEMETLFDKFRERLSPEEYERVLEIASTRDGGLEAIGSDPRDPRTARPGVAVGVGAAVDAALLSADPLTEADGED